MILSFFLIAILTATLTLLQIRFAAKPFEDIPNQRSSHAQPTPSGGGLAICIALFVSYLALIALDITGFWWSVLSVLPLFLVGLIDDYRPVSAKWRLLLQALAVVSMLSLVSMQFQPLTLLLWFISILWWLNLFNFMDGTDGLANGESIFICLALLLLTTTARGSSEEVLLTEHYLLLLLLACGWGFMLFNAAPARIFMGDAGSLFMAGLLALLGYSLYEKSLINAWAILILVAAFAADATMTLIMRALRGERITEAHRSHFYQGLARKWGDHQKVAVFYSLLNIVYLLPLAAIANQNPDSGLLLAVIAYSPLCLLVIISHRRLLTIR